MKYFLLCMLFPFLGVAQPVITSMEVVKPYQEYDGRSTVSETVSVLEAYFKRAGVTVFATIDHQKAAEEVGETMPPATLLVVGNPKVGTPLMKERLLFAIELPLKILVYEENDMVRVHYRRIQVIADKYRLKEGTATARRIDEAMEKLISNALRR